MRTSRWCLWPALALYAAGCASGRSASRSSSDPAAEQRIAEIEARNKELQAELSRKTAELQQSFQAMSQAESAAGLNNLGCVGVSPANAQVQGLPRSGAVHAQFQLRGQLYRMTTTFAAPRTAGAWRLSQGTCKVVGP